MESRVLNSGTLCWILLIKTISFRKLIFSIVALRWKYTLYWPITLKDLFVSQIYSKQMFLKIMGCLFFGGEGVDRKGHGEGGDKCPFYRRRP